MESPFGAPGMTKKEMTDECGEIVPKGKYADTGVGGSRNRTIQKRSIKDGEAFGSGGMNPCVGLLLEYEIDGVEYVSMIHFYVGTSDAVGPTIDSLGPLPEGTKAWIAGGKESHDGSEFTLREVLAQLRWRGFSVEGYTTNDGIFINKKGEIYTSGKD
jgi:hypothetical protein